MVHQKIGICCFYFFNSLVNVNFINIKLNTHSLILIIICILYFREVQLDIKNWQIKEAEKNRKLKMTSKEWLDHPDRYLLELAGRQTYSTS